MAEPVTIDNYDVKIHERYALDQEKVDFTLIQGADQIPRHFEIAALQSNISSKWEELFQTHELRHPWANFSLPPNYKMMRNRFFSFAISPEFDWFIDDQEDEESEEHEEECAQVEEYKAALLAVRSKTTPTAVLEKDRSALLNLVESIQMLNGFLRDVHAKKLQYQKG